MAKQNSLAEVRLKAQHNFGNGYGDGYTHTRGLSGENIGEVSSAGECLCFTFNHGSGCGTPLPYVMAQGTGNAPSLSGSALGDGEITRVSLFSTKKGIGYRDSEKP